jgi:hypothetical protein
LDKRTKIRNMDMRFGTWNIRSLYRACSLVTVTKNMDMRLDTWNIRSLYRACSLVTVTKNYQNIN